MAYGEYQFETSPRKLQPEYEPKKKKQVKRNVTKNVETQQNAKKQAKRKVKTEVKMIVWILLGFAIFCVISYRNSLINESFNDKEKLKQDLAVIQKENEQLQVSIENSLNLANIEQAAKDKLGMQKLTNKQTMYVTLPKRDYVVSASEEAVVEEEKNWFEKIIDQILQK